MASSSSHHSHLSKDEASSMISKTSDTSKGKRFKLKRAGNLLTTTGKPILELKGLGHDDNENGQEASEPQSLFRRHSSNLGRSMKSIRRRLKELKTGSDEVHRGELNVASDDQPLPHNMDDNYSRKSSSWIRRTSLNLSRSLSRTSSFSTPPSIEVTPTRPARHLRSASEVLSSPARPPLTLNRTISGSGSSVKTGGRRLSLNIMKDGTGNAGDGYHSTALEDIVQSPIAVSPDSEAMNTFTTNTLPSPPQVMLSTSTDSAISAIPPSIQSFEVPPLLKSGTPLTKITAKKRQRVVVKVDWDQGQIIWESKPGVWKFIPVESIKEIRTGASASFHLTQFNISQTYLPLWITIIYTASSTASPPASMPLPSSSGVSIALESDHLAISPPSTTTRGSPLLSGISLPSLNALSPKILSGSNGFSYSASTYKSLHLLCPSLEIFRAWEQTLKEMADVRTRLTDGLGFGMGGLNASREIEGMRREMWERREFIGADTTPDSRLSFAEITKMCWKLNVRMSEAELKRLFISADSSHRGFLDFDDFKHFVKLLKARPELDRLYRRILFKASTTGKGKRKTDNENDGPHFTFQVFVDFMRDKQGSTLPESQLKTIFDRYSEPLSSRSSPPVSLIPTPLAVAGLEQEKQLALPLPTPPASASTSPMARSSDLPAVASGSGDVNDEVPESDGTQELRVMTPTSFTSFLMSSDNPALLEPVGAEDEGGFGLARYLHLPHHSPFHLPHLHIPHIGYGHHSHPPSPVGEREEEKKQPQPLSVISHDMTRPMSEYFISSSHNTYLVGHQLVGESTVEGYVRALIAGCRSVEVDIYDSDNGNGPPMIYHGHTLTSKLSLREVCEAILTYGFMESEYPIVISAEVHLSVPGQSQMAKIMREVFGDRLVTKEKEWEKVKQSSPSPTATSPLDDDDAEVEDPDLRAMTSWKIEQLPSPEELKGRILLKTKNLNLLNRKDTLESGTGSPPSSWTAGGAAAAMVDTTTTSSTSDTDGAVFSDLENKARSILQRVRSTRGKPSTIPTGEGGSSSPPSGGFLSRRRSSGTKDVFSSPVSSSPTSPATITMLTPTTSPVKREKSGSKKQKKEKVKMSPDLLPLLVYTVGVKCRGINKKEVYAPEEMFSLSESRADAMLKAGSALDVIKHTRSHLVRIYPKGSRVSSSNYEPHRFWAMGAQLVAINWQTFDTGYIINHAMFQRNGRCGYVLKPLALRIAQSQKEILSKVAEHYFDVTVISAQHLPQDKTAKKDSKDRDAGGVDPYVEVTLHIPDWNNVVASCNAGTSLPGKMDSLSPPGSPTTLSPPPMRTRSGSTGTAGGGNPTTITYRTGVVKNNGFNPVWEEKLRIPYECIGEAQGGMKDLIFVKFTVRTSRTDKEEEPLAVFCASLGTLRTGYRHLPLYDAQMSQYLYSTLFVRIGGS